MSLPHRPRDFDPYNLPSSSSNLVDTSYDSAAHLMDNFDDHGEIRVPEPCKSSTANTPRSALGARLLSTISNSSTTTAAAAALTRSRTILHARAKSLAANYAPKAIPAEGGTPSSTNKLFRDLFGGESAPVHIGFTPSRLKDEDEDSFMEYSSSLTERPLTSLNRNRSQCGSPLHEVTRTSSWFARKSMNAVPALPATQSLEHDEILSLNINTALFPHGPADPQSPHAFNELLLNATALIERMQNAYRTKAACLADLQPEIDVQREEVEESETRSRHLKMQLEDMCRKAAEQDRTLREMAQQLAREKLLRQEESDKAARSVRLVDEMNKQYSSPTRVDLVRRRKRGSFGSSPSDSGFESDMDYAESITSRNDGSESPYPRSPAHHHPYAPLDSSRGVEAWRSQTAPLGGHPRRGGRALLSRQSTFSSSASSSMIFGEQRSLPYVGEFVAQHDDAVWTTVEALRRENHDLRGQVSDMQRSLQGCIDLIGHISL